MNLKKKKLFRTGAVWIVLCVQIEIRIHGWDKKYQCLHVFICIYCTYLNNNVTAIINEADLACP